ncbi:hypothetical protein [Maritalea sp.]|uniref:hypothetical protein n=1 Tax=Maritalea sp. TaxID=2003361 RepID=UPI003EF3A6C8
MKCLFERQPLFDQLNVTPDELQPSAQNIEYIINEFLRILGLTVVGVGREEYFLCTIGQGHLRNLFMSFLLEVDRKKLGGALKLRDVLDDEHLGVLTGLPATTVDRAQIIQTQIIMARSFFQIAKPICKAHNIEWPEQFEAATRAHLIAHLGEQAAI